MPKICLILETSRFFEDAKHSHFDFQRGHFLFGTFLGISLVYEQFSKIVDNLLIFLLSLFLALEVAFHI